MKHFVHRHRRRIVGHGVLVFALLATSVITFDGGTTTLFFMPHGSEKVKVGDTTQIDVNINTQTPINALGATIKFPPQQLQILAISKEKSFLDLWTEDTTIKEGTGEVHFSGGTFRAGGLSGTGTMLTLTVKALQPGSAKIEFSDAEIYSHDGRGLVIDRSLKTVNLVVSPRETIAAAPTTPGQPALANPGSFSPNPDFNGDGKVNLVDASILTYNFFRSYHPQYDLDVDGRIGLSDISILFSKMR